MHGWYGTGWGGGWLLMMLMFLLFWSVVVGLVVFLVRRVGIPRPGHDRPAHDEAERILAERFARGEIDEDEFVSRREALRRSPS
ncbi:SHOCT domain-containing protein [Rhodococcus chondri]|uniref:SHOCT domain-containing protein n=1 Tax=Rhodococcus chondri TaxID=3065941 RepID=A0ABU7JYP4_9NOCA|nr:SHOCT domain-containing protein [Rhodococcus sp. CC-R104]MEE2035135.1 SHOCT domain-containing protein [Rhodococcus sp. CC-R104]